MKIQFTLLVEESKQLIALGTMKHPKLKGAYEKGKIVLKGGTTVSRISEFMLNTPLRICGRITQRGTVSSLSDSRKPHTILVENGKWRNIDEEVAEVMKELSSDDLIVCGANAFDSNGKAALMAGSPGGGNIGQSLSSWYTEGIPVLIPVGIEKMIPGNLDEIINRSGRKGKDVSTGMAVGLFPISGELIREIEAIKYLANVECQAVGSGGLNEANGSVTLEVWGRDEEVNKILEAVMEIKNERKYISGTRESLVECEAPCKSCKNHIGCGYKSGLLKEEKRKKLGIITIGQSPRNDLIPDIENILNKEILLKQCGALDEYKYEEVLEKFSPQKGDSVLVTRMRDGRQVRIGEKYIINLLQKCIDKLEIEGIETILLLCTGKFPKFKHNSLLIKPHELLHTTVSKLAAGEKIGVILPHEDQITQAIEWWKNGESEISIEIASPYGDVENVKKAAQKLIDKDVKFIFMDCMGYTGEMKELVKGITGKYVILPRTLIARMINEIC
ncbi:AroM family protein [Maledivibacter halophilus]|uniref:AroM protein n=1 Tax=Maledivibacter halophilus TaxID=36842 RepID=A0A1T5L2K9_9FIRM|nr:AroM family protein [Maledivibacter halophilus]SKC70286.1 AroM protein [Maledivibacter halophilus]